MKAEELRIGNYVMYAEDQVQFKVIGIDTGGLTVENESDKTWIGTNTFEPIPLTEEWLLKFGLSEIRELENTDIKEYRLFEKYSFCVQFPCGSESHCYAGNYPVAIKYVHQLQNLYYALTGTELIYRN